MELVSANNSHNQQVARLPPLPGPLVDQKRNQNQEIGSRYKLANSIVPHSVPPKGAIQSNGENQLGVIDTWPAHSTNQRPANIQLSLNKFNNLILTNVNAEGQSDNTPKPKFLENLEKFVSRELKALGCAHGHGSNEVRLQAYREAFEYLLEEFKTYKPILSVIKNEYEMMLALQREKIRELEPLKQMLVTLADQCDYKLMQYREEEKNEIKELKEDKKRQNDKMLELKNGNHSLQVQVEKLQSEMSKEHERFRNEQDKRKLLILDLNDLRFQYEEAKLAEMKREKKRMAQGMPDEEDTQDDPVTLKIALRVCRQNLNDSMIKLTKMEADYGDVVPRRDYEALKTANETMTTEYDQMKEEYTKNKTELQNLEKGHKTLQTKYNDVDRQLDENRRDCTPRPDWDRCTSLIDVEKWEKLTENKTSIQNLETMVYELGGKKEGGPKMTEYHAALGTDPEVPAYLRTNGNKDQVKKISVNKRDFSLIIKDFWKQREGQNGTSNDYDDFFFKFLRKRFNNETVAFEYAYAINEAIQGKLDSEYLSQFAQILKGNLDEDVYNNEQKIIKQLLDGLRDKEKEEKSEDDSISRVAFIESLKGLFKYLPRKKENFTDGLMLIVDDELGNDPTAERLDFKTLFIEDFKDKHGLFINSLRGLFKDERQLFAGKIINHIGKDKIDLHHGDVKNAATQEQVTGKELENLLYWCFKSEKTIDLEGFTKRIDTCGYFPTPSVLN